MRAVAFLAVWLAAGPVQAFPDGPPWDAVAGEGCAACHFDSPPDLASRALTLSGLPERVRAGETYRLTVMLRDAAMARSGFLLSARRDAAPAGRFEAVDGRSEALGAKSRSTLAGVEPTGAGEASWTLLWHAPDRPGGPVHFSLWGNAANGDESPLGDGTHRIEIVRPVD